MSLEVAIKENTAAVEKMTEALAAVLAGANGGTTSAPAETKKTETKKAETKKAETKKAETKDEDAFATLRQEIAGWLGEFAKEEDKDAPDGIHPEVTARRDAIKATLGKLKVKQLVDIKDDDAKIERLSKWLHNTAIPVDKGFGVGRLVADPEEEGDSNDLDDI